MYLQFDGVTKEKNSHRGIGNYMDVKRSRPRKYRRRGNENNAAGDRRERTEQRRVGDIIRFVAENVDKIHGVIFQPIMFCGRDEDVSADERYARRYPVSQIAYDLQAQTHSAGNRCAIGSPSQPTQSSPICAMCFIPRRQLGSLFCDIHPNQGIFSPILINSRTREMVPVAKFFDVEQFLRDVVEITDLGRGPAITKAMVALQRYATSIGPRLRPILDLTSFANCLRIVFIELPAAVELVGASLLVRRPWKLVMVTPMSFQDLSNYDFATMSDSKTPWQPKKVKSRSAHTTEVGGERSWNTCIRPRA